MKKLINYEDKKLKILNFLVFFFPICFFFKSFAVNLLISLTGICLLIFYYKEIKEKVLQSNYKYLFLFYISVLVSEIVNFSSLADFLNTIFYIRFLLIVLAIDFLLTNINSKKIISSINIVFFFIFIFFIDLFYQYYFRKDILGYMPAMCLNDDLNHCQRFSGLFGKELIAGGYISTIVISCFIIKYNFEKSKVNILLPIIFLIATYVTGERVALFIVILFIFIFYICCFAKNIKMIIYTTIFILGILIFFYSMLSDSLKSRYVNDLRFYFYNKENKLSFDSFLQTSWGLHYQAAYQMFVEQPIFGNGYKSFRKKCHNYNYFKKEIENVQSWGVVCSTHPHNIHLEILAERGIITYLFFLIFIIKNFLLYFRSSLKNKYKFNFVILGFMLIFIFLPKSTGSIFSTTYASFFWFTSGIGLSILKINNLKLNK